MLPHSLLQPEAQQTGWFIIQDFCSGHVWQPQEGNPLPRPTLEGGRWSIPMGRPTHCLHGVVSSCFHVVCDITTASIVWVTHLILVGKSNEI